MAFMNTTSTLSLPNMTERPEPTSQSSASPSNSFWSPRSRKQLSLFFAGASFFAFSGLITRRSLHRRYMATMPRFYQPSNRPANAVNGPLEAVEALSIATINVTSFMMMMVGGLLWAFDISNINDMRRKVRGGLGVDGTGRSETEAEEELEEWLATVLARKDEKDKRKAEDKGKQQRQNDRGQTR